MYITDEWKKRYEEVKDLLVSPIDYQELFRKKELKGKALFILDMGAVNFPTGNIFVRDPLVFLKKDDLPYFKKVPKGVFPLETLVIELKEGNYRYLASRVRFSDEKAKVYRIALKGDENFEGVNRDSIYGFLVDAGLATVVDEKTRDAFVDFCEAWYEQNPDKNIYDDFFCQEFKKSYEEKPAFQREEGDWINFKLEGTDLSVPMIQSGFGDGLYPVYFGMDQNNNICELIIEYIYPGERA